TAIDTSKIALESTAQIGAPITLSSGRDRGPGVVPRGVVTVAAGQAAIGSWVVAWFGGGRRAARGWSPSLRVVLACVRSRCLFGAGGSAGARVAAAKHVDGRQRGRVHSLSAGRGR